MNIELTLDRFNELLKQAKAASNCLHYPDVVSEAELRLQGAIIYRAIVAVEDELRAGGKFRWASDHWEAV